MICDNARTETTETKPTYQDACKYTEKKKHPLGPIEKRKLEKEREEKEVRLKLQRERGVEEKKKEKEPPKKINFEYKNLGQVLGKTKRITN